MKDFLKRISSRKFLTALAVVLASVVALFTIKPEDELVDAFTKVAALAAMALTALGYIKTEGALDADPNVKRPK